MIDLINRKKSQMKTKLLILTIIFLNSLLSFGQDYIGKWEHLNNEKENVIIEFGKNAEYIISIPNRHLGAIERQESNNLPTILKYKIDFSSSPAKIDVTSKISGSTIHGIIDIIDSETIQIQINPIPNGIRPTKFDPSSENYVKCRKLLSDQQADGI